MSILSPPPASSGGLQRKPDGVRTYRGRRLEEIIPQIREELGPDAVILRQREGLTGGVSGFFAQRCVEVDARAGTPPVDVYDDDDDYDFGYGAASSFASELADAETGAVARVDFSSAVTRLGEILAAAGAEDSPAADDAQDSPVADDVEDSPAADDVGDGAVAAVWEQVAPGPERVERAPAITEPRGPKVPSRLDADLVAAGVDELGERGISDAWADELIALGVTHHKPFADGDLREAIRSSVAAGLPAPASLPVSGAAVAIVGAGGSGKTRVVAALASAYARGSAAAVTVVSLGGGDAGREIAELLCDEGGVHIHAAANANDAAIAVAEGREHGLVVIDTPALRPGAADGVCALARELDALALDAVYVAVPVTLSARAARNLIDGCAPVKPSGIVITHADEIDQLGVAVELSHHSGLAVAYVHEGLDLGRALSAATPFTLAKRLMP